MNDLSMAIVACVFLIMLLSCIQIAADTKTYSVRNYFTFPLFLYLCIMTIGNILATIAAAKLIDSEGLKFLAKANASNKDGIPLKDLTWLWLWYSAFGVFGFEAIIQKINITIFDKGVLSINEWISKAKISAVAATLERIADNEIAFELKLAGQIHKSLSKDELHTFASNNLGPQLYQKEIDSVTGKPNIDVDLHLAYLLTNKVPKRVNAIIVAHPL